MKTYPTNPKSLLSVSLLLLITVLSIQITSYANTAPVFTNGESTNRNVRENTAADENIGNPVAATDDDDDTLTYSLGGTDAASFTIDTDTGQLKTLAALDYETQTSYDITIDVTDGNGGNDSIDVTVRVKDIIDLSTPLDERTRQVKNAIVRELRNQNIQDNIGDRHLLLLTTLVIQSKTINTLQSGDFSGLTNLQYLYLPNNSIESLPEDVFDGLSNLERLTLNNNSFDTLPEDVFDGLSNLEHLSLGGSTLTSLPEGIFEGLSNLEELRLLSNRLSSLPEDVFDGLSNLEKLYLSNMQVNRLSSLPEAIFEGLSNLEELYLQSNGLESLPDDIFDGLSNLKQLRLDYNDLTELPEGLFDGLTSLTHLNLSNNSEPLRVRVSLSKVADGEFKATARTAAPFEIVLPVLATNASIDGGATTITIPKGEMESDPLTVTRNAGTNGIYEAVTVNIGDPLPSKPNNHFGYSLVKSDNLPLEVLPYLDANPVFTEGSTTTRSVAENTASLRNIQPRVSATPHDSKDTLTYTLGGTDSASFRIYRGTGLLRTYAALDYETKNSYSVTVTATDSDGLSSTIDVTINVTDVDENPVFAAGSSTTRSVAENTNALENIGTPVSATPYDSNDTLTYTLGGTDSASFRINSNTGQLRTSAALDYETKNSYSVTVTATDSDSRTNTIAVTINVTNVNEAPQFNEDSPTREVDENTSRGVNIGEPISATDPDANTTLSYTLSGTNAANKFNIVGATGQLRTKAALNYENQTSYSVTVNVSDGLLRNRRSIDVTINVNDLFDESTSLSNRTSEVTDAIVAALSDVDSADAVTDADLGTITSLNFSDADIDSLQNGDFSGLSALAVLTLDSNSLTSLPSNVFSGLSALTNLDLSSNSLTGLPSNVFSGLSALTNLDLSSNSITSLWSSTFRSLRALTDLDLSSNSFTSLHENMFEKLSKLENLDLSSNSITTLSSTVFDELSKLENLDLSSNDITSPNAGVFEELSELRSLDMSENSLSSLPDHIFTGLTLAGYNLSGNTVDPLSINVKIEKSTNSDGNKGIKGVVRTGATYLTFITVEFTNGTGYFSNGEHTSEGERMSVIVNKGKQKSPHVRVTRNSGTTGAVTAQITSLGTGPPSADSGYEMVLNTTELEIYPAVNDGAAPPNSIELIPDTTECLPNYPNPFNPETWIPYQLAKASTVQITIYNARGVVVRRLDLGHQRAGYYTNRSRAAHWDGKNAQGERVASGIYFYQFKADKVSFLRKMLILK